VKHINETIDALRTLDQDGLVRLLALVRDCTGTIWLCGNGGSASTAQHWACDLTKQANKRAVTLGSNPALLTAYANDIGYGDVFREELRVFGRQGDVLIALSCSGNSSNITDVLTRARQQMIPSVLLTGIFDAGHLPVDVLIRIGSADYGVIEDCHLAIGHWLAKEVRHAY
jgi:D-sedoheptulose 7-phosphate isomerase